ncbi:MAG TPA: LLM class flavin-dependent oxidoreductase [Pseudonocardiaceae bacterium]|nr:LLM class flavin-dependent oxidoreductase [Pseudonocardiaceae bacterium]
MIKSWIFDSFLYTGDPRPEEFDPASCAELYQEYLGRWVAAEDHGFTGVFFSEHHFAAYNLSPSPNLLVAAVAARTERLLLGVMSNTVAVHHPVRLAEECGMLDQLSNGRLQIGLGPGSGPREPGMLGIAAEDVRPLFREGVEVVVAALSGAEFSHHGKFHDFERLAVWPRPVQRPLPPVWITVMSVDSAIWAGTQGFLAATAWAGAEEVKRRFDAYQEAADAAGQPTGPDRVALRRRVFVTDTDERAHTVVDAARDQFFEVTLANAGGRAESAVRDLMCVPDDFVIGSVDTVTERLIEQARFVGTTNILCWTDFKAFAPRELNHCHELLAQVNERLRQADVATATPA